MLFPWVSSNFKYYAPHADNFTQNCKEATANIHKLLAMGPLMDSGKVMQNQTA